MRGLGRKNIYNKISVCMQIYGVFIFKTVALMHLQYAVVADIRGGESINLSLQ